MANNTGIVMDDDLQETGNADTGVDAAEQDVVAEAEKTATEVTAGSPSELPQGEVKPLAEAGESDSPAIKSATEVTNAAADTEKKFTQSQLDAIVSSHDEVLQAQITRYKDQAARSKADADDYKERHSKSCAFARKKDSLLAQAYAQMDIRDSKLFDLISKYVQAQLDAEEKKELSTKLQKSETELQKMTSDNLRLQTKNEALDKSNGELSSSVESLKSEVAKKDSQLTEQQEELERWQGVGGRIVSAMEPQCLTGKLWFDELKSELQSQVLADQPSDSAMLVFASLSELAVMERSPSGPCFEWKKQLADIGLVVASYMHQKKSSEGDVLKMLHNFAQAFQEMPILKKLKIMCWIPDLGGDFPTDKVKHKNNGTMVAKVHNWCIVEDGHVYCKAIVE